MGSGNPSKTTGAKKIAAAVSYICLANLDKISLIAFADKIIDISPALRGKRKYAQALNFLFSDGEHLYAYRLGDYELHWLAREGQVLVASDRLTDEMWHDVRQDVLLVLSPGDDEPHAERLLGDDGVASVQFIEPPQSEAAPA